MRPSASMRAANVAEKTAFNTQYTLRRPADKTERRSYNGYYQIDGMGWTKAT